MPGEVDPHALDTALLEYNRSSPARTAEVRVDSLAGFEKKPLQGLRIGVLKEGFAMPQLDPNIEKAVRSSIADLSALGAELIDISIPEHTRINTPWTCIQALAGGRDGLLGDQTGRKGLQMTDRAFPSDVKDPYISQARFDSFGPGAKNMYLKYLYMVEKYGTLVHKKAANVIRRQTRAEQGRT